MSSAGMAAQKMEACMAKGAARRHHFVPQCYLKAFAVSKKAQSQTTVFDGVTRTSYVTSVANVAAERDFNRFEAEGMDPNALEAALASFEGDLAPALDRIIANGSLSDVDDRANLLNFMCLLSLRNPRLRETMRSAQEQTAKIVMDLALASKDRWESQLRHAQDGGFMPGGHNVSYEDMRKFVEEGAFKVDVANERHIQMELELFPKILPYFFGRGWVTMRAPRGNATFVTCDHPVFISWSDPKMRGGFYGPGLGVPGTEIIFPVSAKMAVVGAFELKDGEKDLDEEAVAGVNGAMVAAAERQIFARDANFMYTLQYSEQPKKANKLLRDPRFKRPRSGAHEDVRVTRSDEAPV